LRELSLRGNRLAALPASLGRLRRLATLDLRGNQLDELPDTLLDLPLTKLDLRWNPLRGRPRWLDELTRRGCLVYA
jgi:Leucine-rich repeat (LRR) protein